MLRIVSPTTENRKCPGSMSPACTGPTGISYTPGPSTVQERERAAVGRTSAAAARRRGASGTSPRASAGGARGGRAGMTGGHDAEQVAHLSFEAAGRERQSASDGTTGADRVEVDAQLDAAVGWAGGEQVDDAQRVPSSWAATSARRTPPASRLDATTDQVGRRDVGGGTVAADVTRSDPGRGAARRSSGAPGDGGGGVEEPLERPDGDAEGGAARPGRRRAVPGEPSVATRCLGRQSGRAEQHPLAVAEHGGERSREQDHGDGGGPAQAGGDPGAGDADLAGEQAERREAEQGEQPGPKRRRAAGGGRAGRATPSIAVVPSPCRISPGAEEQHGSWRGRGRGRAAARRPGRAGCRRRRRGRAAPCARCWSRRASACSRAGRSAATPRRQGQQRDGDQQRRA